MTNIAARGMIIFLVAVITLSAPGFERVLCIGADGHAHIEFLDIAGKCSPTPGKDHSSCADVEDRNLSLYFEERRCSRCVDIPLPAIDIEKATVNNTRPAWPAAGTPAFSAACFFSPHSETSSLIARPGSIDSRPATHLLTTVILLI